MKSPKIISLVGLPKRICTPVHFPLSDDTRQQIEMLKLAFRDSFAEHQVYSLGLCAPQIDVWKRFLIMPKNFHYGQIKDFRQMKYKVREFNTYINPQIVDKSSETVEMNEYCLSIGFNQYRIKRPKYVEVQYCTENGTYVQEVLDSLRSRVIQHEMDHLDGILMSELPGAKKLVRAGKAEKTKSESS